MRFRLAPLALGGLLFQLVLFSARRDRAHRGPAGPALYVASTLAVLVALLANLRLPGLWILALGAGMNLLAIVANGGYMPSSPEAWMALNGLAEVPTDAYTNSAIMTSATALPGPGRHLRVPAPAPAGERVLAGRRAHRGRRHRVPGAADAHRGAGAGPLRHRRRGRAAG